jgi:hypothetical protein
VSGSGFDELALDFDWLQDLQSQDELAGSQLGGAPPTWTQEGPGTQPGGSQLPGVIGGAQRGASQLPGASSGPHSSPGGSQLPAVSGGAQLGMKTNQIRTDTADTDTNSFSFLD